MTAERFPVCIAMPELAASLATAAPNFEAETGMPLVPTEAVTDPRWRRQAAVDQRVIWIDDGRPQTDGDRRRELLPSFTTAADVIVGSLAEAAAAVGAPAQRDLQPITETVHLDGGRSYPIIVGHGVTGLLDELLPASAKRVAIITQEGIDADLETEREHRTFTIEDGESAKRLDTIGQLASEFASWGLTRADVVVSVGGGVVTDIGGFVASAYHRGLPVVHVSTTLLGQIDAAIGGKCGVNLPEGKNLVGAFWQPTAVLCPTEALETLPAREFLSGMGELAKYHFLGGGDLDRLALVPRVAASARIKANVVSGDEREGGQRAILNYGHTLAHALETVAAYDLRHGEAVAIGLIYAAELARNLGRIDEARVAEHRRVVASYGLACTLDSSFDRVKLVELFSRDKKALDGVTFVLDGPNGVEPVRVDDTDLLLETLDTLEEQKR